MAENVLHTILLVDDSPVDLRMHARMLESGDRRIIEARSGEEALVLAVDSDFALIVLDVQLSGLDGFEIAERLRQEGPSKHTPIIFVSGAKILDEHVFQGYDSGAVDYLFKPVEKNLLVSKARVFCELHEQKAVIRRQLSEITAKNEELQKRLDEIKTLRGMIPICVSCKKIRDDHGFWEGIEIYISSVTEAQFSHGLCPECVTGLYPDLYPSQSKPMGAA